MKEKIDELNNKLLEQKKSFDETKMKDLIANATIPATPIIQQVVPPIQPIITPQIQSILTPSVSSISNLPNLISVANAGSVGSHITASIASQGM
jgi:hypothetical protein